MQIAVFQTVVFENVLRSKDRARSNYGYVIHFPCPFSEVYIVIVPLSIALQIRFLVILGLEVKLV